MRQRGLSLQLSDQVMRLHRDVSYRDPHVGCILLELAGYELLACIGQDEVRWPEIQVDPTTSELLSCVLCADVFQPSTRVKAGGLIYNMQDWLANDVEDVHDDVEVEVDIIFDGEAEVTGQATVPLTSIAILCQVAEYSDIYFVSGRIENSFKTTNRWVAEAAVQTTKFNLG